MKGNKIIKNNRYCLGNYIFGFKPIIIMLNLPEYKFKIKTVNDKKYIFDLNRKKWVRLTPEEWVRQNFIQYLIHEKKYPAPLIKVEGEIVVNKMKRRGDIIVYKNSRPFLIVECKAPEVEINQSVFEQIAQYNIPLKVIYLIVTNGIKHFCCKMNYFSNSYEFLNEIPDYFAPV